MLNNKAYNYEKKREYSQKHPRKHGTTRVHTTTAKFNYYNTAEAQENHVGVDRWLRG